jgi:hypothetical protein
VILFDLPAINLIKLIDALFFQPFYKLVQVLTTRYNGSFAVAKALHPLRKGLDVLFHLKKKKCPLTRF